MACSATLRSPRRQCESNARCCFNREKHRSTDWRTTYLGLAALVTSPRWEPEVRGLKAGCIGVLDTATWSISAVTAPRLADFEARAFDFDAWCDRTLPAP